MHTNALTLPPDILGFWTRCLRTTMEWSQEALAAAANLDIRTIQRIEAGKPVSVTTRRSLARGFGYENPNVFDDPDSVSTILKLLNLTAKTEDLEKQYPEHMPVVAARVIKVDAIVQLVGDAEAYLFHSDDDLSSEAKQQAACLFDYLYDLGDIWRDISFTERLTYSRDIDRLVCELGQAGAVLYQGSRSTKMVGQNWADKTPMAMSIAYLVAVPKDKEITQIVVPRRRLA